jgi:hypothetical protein
MERINATTGMQECVQICSGGGQEWTTRWFGDRSMFPRVARVNKRTLEEGGLANEEEMEEEMEEEADAGELATPMNKERPIKGGRRVVSAPQAPRRTARNSTPTGPRSESTYDTFEHPRHTAVREALARGNRDQSGRRKTYSHEEMAVEREMERMKVKEEESDDLFSLCGRVRILDVQSIVSGSILH